MFSRVKRRIKCGFLLFGIPFLILAACDDDRPTTIRSRRVDNRVINKIEKKDRPRIEEESRVQKAKTSKRITQPIPTLDKPNSAPRNKKSEPREDATEKERNLEAELRSLIGNPMQCLSLKSDDKVPDTIEIALEAYVTANGIVSRSSVRSPYLSNIVLSCVKERIDNARFRAPIDDAPRAIRTTVALRQVNSASAKPR